MSGDGEGEGLGLGLGLGSGLGLGLGLANLVRVVGVHVLEEGHALGAADVVVVDEQVEGAQLAEHLDELLDLSSGGKV